MKKLVLICMAALLLTGCADTPVMETVADEIIEPAAVAAGRIQVELPEEAAVPVMEGGESRLYLCEDYELMIQTLEGGDLSKTVAQLTGYEKEKLTVLQTIQNGLNRYDFVWVCAGEEGEQLGRGVILDDGNYHYAMTALRPAEDTEHTQIVWRRVFESFSLA